MYASGSKPSGGDTLHDIGNLTTSHFDAGDLTRDGAWHTLDLSSIVPAGVELVRVKLTVTMVSTTDYFMLKNADFANDFNRIVANGNVVGDSSHARGLISCNSNREIKYKIKTGVTVAFLFIVGWVVK